MGRLDGRVAIVTGAGRGLGRAHALFLASEGAAVVVNDLGADLYGQGAAQTPAQDVAKEIQATGGRAVASHHDIADWDQAADLIRLAVTTFGALHVVVNNAGILRDRSLANMNEGEWDAVIRVHLKGHATTTRHALAYWREQSRAGTPLKASLIHTTSISGLAGNFGQANYAAAKLGIVGLSRVAAMEGGKYGVRSNAISPSGRTRMTEDTPAGAQQVAPPSDPNAFDPWDPANVSPLIGWLAAENCPATSQIFQVVGRRLFVMTMPTVAHTLDADGRWTLEDLDRALAGRLVEQPPIESFFIGL